jgi:hypothetical protein
MGRFEAHEEHLAFDRAIPVLRHSVRGASSRSAKPRSPHYSPVMKAAERPSHLTIQDHEAGLLEHQWLSLEAAGGAVLDLRADAVCLQRSDSGLWASVELGQHDRSQRRSVGDPVLLPGARVRRLYRALMGNNGALTAPAVVTSDRALSKGGHLQALLDGRGWVRTSDLSRVRRRPV